MRIDRGTIRTFVALVIGFGLVAFLIWHNRAEIARLRHSPPALHWMLVAFLVVFSGLYLTFIRWYLLVRAQGLTFPFSDAQRLGFVGLLFNQVIPGAVSGDLVKLGLFAREQEKLGLGMATIAVDRIVGMYGLFLVGSVAALWNWGALSETSELRRAALLVLAAAAASTAVLCGMVLASAVPAVRRVSASLPLVGRALGETVESLAVYRGKYGAVLVALGLACVSHTLFIVALYCCALAFPGPIWPFAAHAVAAPLGLAINAVPLTSGGIGVGEAAMQEIYRVLGYDGGKAFLMMLSYRVLCWIVSLGGVPYLIRSARVRRRLETATQ